MITWGDGWGWDEIVSLGWDIYLVEDTSLDGMVMCGDNSSFRIVLWGDCSMDRTQAVEDEESLNKMVV